MRIVRPPGRVGRSRARPTRPRGAWPRSHPEGCGVPGCCTMGGDEPPAGPPPSGSVHRASAADDGLAHASCWCSTAHGSGSHRRSGCSASATWGVLALALRRCSALVRAQTLVVVAFATVVEYVVQPGAATSTSTGSTTCRCTCRRVTASSTSRPSPSATPRSCGARLRRGRGAGDPRRRALGRRTACCSPTGPTRWARSGSSAWSASCAGARRRRCTSVRSWSSPGWSWLGTHLGTWAWQTDDFGRAGVAIGNPPVGAAGGYGWFDLAALLAAPALLRWCGGRARLRASRPQGASSCVGRSAAAGTPACTEVVHRPARSAARRRASSGRPADEPRKDSAWSCSRPLVASALPPVGPARPSSEVNMPPASRTIDVERRHVVAATAPAPPPRPPRPRRAACRTRSRRTRGCASTAGRAPGSRRAGRGPPSRRARSRTATRPRAGTRRRPGTARRCSSDLPVQAPPSFDRPPAPVERGAETTPTTTSSSTISAIRVAQTGTPRTKFLVPSIGSITQRRWLCPVEPCLLAEHGVAGPGPRQRAADALLDRWSASVTGVRSGLVITRRSSAWNRLVVSESASSARTCASRRSSV